MNIAYKNWLPPRKRFFLINTNIWPLHDLGINRLRDGFVSQGFTNEIATGNVITALESFTLDIRPCDTIVFYIKYQSSIFSNNTVAPVNEADGTTELIDGITDDAIYNKIISLNWNGANVTIFVDSHLQDHFDAPYNVTVNVDNSLTVRNYRSNPSVAWPSEVKVISASHYDVPSGFERGAMYQGSYTYQSSWFAHAIRTTLQNFSWNPTYSDLVRGINSTLQSISTANLSTFNASTNSSSTTFALTTPDYGTLQVRNLDAYALATVKSRLATIAGASSSILSERGMINKAWTPPSQVGAIKKAVIVNCSYGTGSTLNPVQVTVDGTTFGATQIGTSNDSLLMYKMLTEVKGVLPQNIVMYRARASKAEVLQALDWLVTGNAAGNTLLFFFSGHGFQMNDSSSDEIDAKDEFILLHKTGTVGEILRDDEIYSKFRNVSNRVYAFFDCCNSGTMMDAHVIVKSMTAGQYTKLESQSLRSDTASPMNMHAYTACDDNKLTYFRSLRLQNIPTPPVGYTWMANEFGYFTYAIWAIMNGRSWAAISNRDMIVQLKQSYNLDTDTSMALTTPYYGTFLDGLDAANFFDL